MQRGVGRSGELRDRGIDLGARMEEDFDDAEAGKRLRFHVLDIVDGDGEAALGADGDGFGHFLGRDAAIAPDDADHGDIDLREDIGGHAEDGEHAQNHDQHRHDDEGVGAA